MSGGEEERAGMRRGQGQGLCEGGCGVWEECVSIVLSSG